MCLRTVAGLLLLCLLEVSTAGSKQGTVHGKIKFAPKPPGSFPKGSCLVLKVQDNRIADASSIDISTKVLKYQDLKLHDGALQYNITFTKPTENHIIEYSISVLLNMHWCSSDKDDNSDWLHSGDYFTATSFGIEISDKKDIYKADIEVEHYQKSNVHTRKEDDPCYRAPCFNSICRSFSNGSYECIKIAKMPCAIPMCADIYDPICANNGKTYSSECVMSGDSCVDGTQIDLFKVHDGECYSRSGMLSSLLFGVSVLTLTLLGLITIFWIWKRNRMSRLRKRVVHETKVAPLDMGI